MREVLYIMWVILRITCIVVGSLVELVMTMVFVYSAVYGIPDWLITGLNAAQ